MPLAGAQLAALAYAPALCIAPLIGFAYYAAIASGRVTSSDFFISSAIDLGLANRVGGTGVSLLLVSLAAAVCVRAAFVAQLGAEWRVAAQAHGSQSAGSDSGAGPFFAHSAVLDLSAEPASAPDAYCCGGGRVDWNQWSVRCALSGAAIGIAVTHFNYAFSSVVHLSLAFAAFLLILVAVLAQCAVDARLEDAASAAIAASSSNGSSSASAHRGAPHLDSDVRAALVGNAAAKHGKATGLLPPSSIAATLSGGLPAHRRLRRWLAAVVVLGFAGMFATIAFSLALSSACELALVAALIASIASWAPDLARVRMRLDFAPLSTAGDTDELAAVVRVSA
jgi:hypothetical protein